MTAAPKPPAIKLRVLAHGRGLPLPKYETAGAAGLDLRAAVPAASPLTIEPGAFVLVPTALAIALPTDMEAQVRPRSGLAARHGVTVLNAPGTIDADYRGEISVILINHSKTPYVIHRGDRIAQMIVAPVRQVELVKVATLDETERGSGGFGSTGVRARASSKAGKPRNGVARRNVKAKPKSSATRSSR